jgi:hypothetical protein
MPIPAEVLNTTGPRELDIDLFLGYSLVIDGIVSVDGIVYPLTGLSSADVIGAIKATDSGAVLVAFTGTMVDATAARIRVSLSPTQTAALSFALADGEQLGVYDFGLKNGTDKVVIQRGKVRGRYKRNAG